METHLTRAWINYSFSYSLFRLTYKVRKNNLDAVLGALHLAHPAVPAVIRIALIGPIFIIQGEDMPWAMFHTGPTLDTTISIKRQVHGFSFFKTGPFGPGEIITLVFQLSSSFSGKSILWW